MSETQSRKRLTGVTIAIIVIAVVVVLFLPIIPVETSYEVEEKREVRVNYKYDHYYREILAKILPPDWELEYVCTIENVDAVGGTFTVKVTFFDRGIAACTASDIKYIGPGQKTTFYLRSSGLAYSTDWGTRYTVESNITPPTKIETHIVTKYKTKYVSLFQLLTGAD